MRIKVRTRKQSGRPIWPALLIVGLVCAGGGYYYFGGVGQKGNLVATPISQTTTQSTTNATANSYGNPISSDELYRLYQTNPSSADSKYTGRFVYIYTYLDSVSIDNDSGRYYSVSHSLGNTFVPTIFYWNDTNTVIRIREKISGSALAGYVKLTVECVDSGVDLSAGGQYALYLDNCTIPAS